MFKRRWFVALAGLLLMLPAARAVDLTPIERTWLEAALPVLSFARQQALPLDIIVQPQPTPGQTPLGMTDLPYRVFPSVDAARLWIEANPGHMSRPRQR